MKQFIDLLGYKVKDAVTGFEGVVSSVSFDLYGCVQAIVTPATVNKDGKIGDSHWFDVKRLIKTSKKPVMAVSSFEGKTPTSVNGPEKKPAMTQHPVR